MGSCKTCRHSDRQAIESAILAQVAERTIADRFGISRSSIHRHAARHLPAHLSRAAEAESVSAAADLLAELRQVLARERAGEEQAAEIKALALAPGGDRRVALRCIDVGGRCRDRQARALSLLAELRGLKPGVSVTLDNWPAPPPSPEAELAKLSPEELAAVVDHMRQARSIIERGGAESWTDGATWTSTAPNGNTTS